MVWAARKAPVGVVLMIALPNPHGTLRYTENELSNEPKHGDVNVNGMNFFILGGVLVLWIAVLATLILNPKGKLLGPASNTQVLVPIGVTLFIWAWILAMVVFN